MTCAFCSATDDLVLCGFAVWKQVGVPVEDAAVGDAWITQQEHKRGRIVEIVDVDMEANGRNGLYRKLDGSIPDRTLQIWVLIPGHPKPYPYIRYCGSAAFIGEREVPCEAPACWRHRCERGPNATFCANHWTSLAHDKAVA